VATSEDGPDLGDCRDGLNRTLTSQCRFRGKLTSLTEFFGTVDLSEIDFSTVQRWISEQKCSPKTVRNRFGTFRLVMQYAKHCGLLQSFDFKGLRFPKQGLINQPCFTVDESKKIIEAAREPFRTMFWLVAETGMRGGEVCGLQVEDILHHAVFVRRPAWRGKLQTPKIPKTDTAPRNFRGASRAPCQAYLLGSLFRFARIGWGTSISR
jgi:integrase